MIYKKFGRLTVLEECKERKGGKKVYKCICDCGNIKNVMGTSLRDGTTRSCGCLARENTRKRSITHGQSHTRLYKIHNNIKDRCCNANSKDYPNYGGRGIKVWDEWLKFKGFYDWSMSNGYNDTLTIDRIDVDGNYEPSNCRWVDMKTQQNNRRNNVYLTYKNKTQTMSQWADELRISVQTIKTRHRKGWSDKDCLFGRGYNEPKTIYKYDYKTNRVLCVYNSIKDASLDNNIDRTTISQQLKKHILHTTQRGFYFGYSPKITLKIYCYDNENLELIDVYCSIKEASEKTGVDQYSISRQCLSKTKLNNRIKGSTGLFFEKKP